MNKTWKIGVAFIRGLNMYGHGRITQMEMNKICRQLEDDQLTILSIIKPDTILFRKKGIHYAAVGQKLERLLTSYFGKPFYVTTRSMRTLQSIVEKYQKEALSYQP
jgi:uncharacterized protein (DUF1697 family)